MKGRFIFEFAVAAFLGCMIFSPLLAGPFPAPTNHVRLELISEVDSAQPGRAIRLGLLFNLDPEWHIYWQNPGDSGEPPRIEWKLPLGYPSRRDAMANSKADGKTSHSGLRVRETSDADCCSADAQRFADRTSCHAGCTREVAGLPRDLRSRKSGCHAYAAGSSCTGEEVGRMGAAIRGSQQGVAQAVAVGLEGRGGCHEGSFRFDLTDGQANFRSSFLSARGKPG